MGQIIGTVNVQVNRQQNATVRSISYGSRTLKSATDLFLDNAQSGDVIQYDATTKTFSVGPIQESPPEIDGGIF